ncbi:MAG: winged helix-turn-helix domain-containing protein [Alphaproteobacteria bacterium]|nr:winged helix-turn-helix domain-containing protein [Alphaproteobacteria bacterium]
MARASGQTEDGVSFGPFTLLVRNRLLTREGVPLKLGARALDILIALVSSPNELLTKKDLMARIWPDVTVEEGSLRFHIAGLRKALGDGKAGARYITTLAGRGYSFVAPVTRVDTPDMPTVSATNFPHANLPSRVGRIIGRDRDLLKISTQLTTSRFVNIVGAGGIGKTTIAIAVGHHLFEAFAGSVLFVDLGMLGDPKLAASAVASMLGLSVQSHDATPSLVAYLREKRVLLVLDTCEHLIEAVAELTASIIAGAPQVHILATSREPLRVEGEHVYRLDALACPPENRDLTAAAVQRFPAAQLFVERAVASGAHLSVSDLEAPIVADICRKLGGVALAIELAARRVDTYGLRQTAALLDQRMTLLWQGLRTAPPRHKTLLAALDWSYGLLSDPERVVLRRLAVFVGHFTLDAALEVVTSTTLDRQTVFAAIDSLVAKSMVATHLAGAMMRYRLLDTTRAYALDINIDEIEAADLAVRHATYYRRWLEQTETEWATLMTGAERTPQFTALNNVRAALEWSFGEAGDVKIGLGLATAAAPIFLSMSLLTECHRWSERAILALDEANRAGRDEMHLQTALGVSLMFTRGGQEAARLALNRGLAIAESRTDPLEGTRALGPLAMFYLRTGSFNAALKHAKRCSVLARASEDEAAIEVGHSVLGTSLHLSGDLASARVELEAALARNLRALPQSTAIYLGFEGRHLAGAILARTLWLQGHPMQAIECARKTVNDAATMDHSLTLSIALIWAISVFLWTGDLLGAEEYVDGVVSRATSNSLAPYLAVARGFQGELAIRRGDTRGGVAILQESLAKLHALPYELLTTSLDISLVQGLAALGRFDEGISYIEETTRRVEVNGDRVYMPELLRVRGRMMLSHLQHSREDAEACFVRSLELSRADGSRAWELRTATDLASLWAEQGRSERARGLLLPVFEQFTEGLDSDDLKAAQGMLKTVT